MDWGSCVAGLGLWYIGWARLWPHLFARGYIEHGHPVPEGWQMGRSIAWRLPVRGAVIIGVLSGIPPASTLVLEGWALRLVLIAFGLGFGALWLLAPPGQRLGTSVEHGSSGELLFILHGHGRPLRAAAVLAFFGALPAAAVGAAVANLL